MFNPTATATASILCWVKEVLYGSVASVGSDDNRLGLTPSECIFRSLKRAAPSVPGSIAQPDHGRVPATLEEAMLPLADGGDWGIRDKKTYDSLMRDLDELGVRLLPRTLRHFAMYSLPRDYRKFLVRQDSSYFGQNCPQHMSKRCLATVIYHSVNALNAHLLGDNGQDVWCDKGPVKAAPGKFSDCLAFRHFLSSTIPSRDADPGDDADLKNRKLVRDGFKRYFEHVLNTFILSLPLAASVCHPSTFGCCSIQCIRPVTIKASEDTDAKVKAFQEAKVKFFGKGGEYERRLQEQTNLKAADKRRLENYKAQELDPDSERQRFPLLAILDDVDAKMLFDVNPDTKTYYDPSTIVSIGVEKALNKLSTHLGWCLPAVRNPKKKVSPKRKPVAKKAPAKEKAPGKKATAEKVSPKKRAPKKTSPKRKPAPKKTKAVSKKATAQKPAKRAQTKAMKPAPKTSKNPVAKSSPRKKAAAKSTAKKPAPTKSATRKGKK